jgi:hypothetical protein
MKLARFIGEHSRSVDGAGTSEPGSCGRAKGGERAHPPGVLYRCEYKEVAGKGICKIMKIKAYQIDDAIGGVCNVMKTNERQKQGASWVIGSE